MGMEDYEGWKVITQIPPAVDIVTRRFRFGKNKWLQMFIEDKLNGLGYELNLYGSNPFKFDTNIPLRSKDYHSLCNEANDTLRGLFTETHEYLIGMIKELPEV